MRLSHLVRRARRAVGLTVVAVVTTGALVATPAVSATGQFSDTAGNQFAADIQWMVGKGITTGYSDGTFRPTAPVTRQAMAAFLTRYMDTYSGSFARYEAPARARFKDVPVGHQFYREISYLVDAGVVAGYDDGTFRPTASVSRQAMAAFLTRLLEVDQAMFNELKNLTLFRDVRAGSQFAGHIHLLWALEVVDGYPDGTFRPTAPVSRQAAAAFLHRFDVNVIQQISRAATTSEPFALLEESVDPSVEHATDSLLQEATEPLLADALG